MVNGSPVLCIGGMHFDSIARCLSSFRIMASNPVRYVRFAGGDADGYAILQDTKRRGVDLTLVSQRQTIPTASNTAVPDTAGELAVGLSDTQTYDLVTPEFLAPYLLAKIAVSYSN